MPIQSKLTDGHVEATDLELWVFLAEAGFAPEMDAAVAARRGDSGKWYCALSFDL